MHPIIEATAGVRALLKGVADSNPTFMSTDDKAVALTELVRAEAQLAELRLRILGDAGDLAEATAARDAAGRLLQGIREDAAAFFRRDDVRGAVRRAVETLDRKSLTGNALVELLSECERR